MHLRRARDYSPALYTKYRIPSNEYRIPNTEYCIPSSQQGVSAWQPAPAQAGDALSQLSESCRQIEGEPFFFVPCLIECVCGCVCVLQVCVCVAVWCDKRKLCKATTTTTACPILPCTCPAALQMVTLSTFRGRVCLPPSHSPAMSCLVCPSAG